ncbi:DUF6114 domain-containing protein, partial [Streptomyces sp. URMC 123]|uniref:DUF6114 domain-containing protein n=1 Tax=Streptomyces sp. URMC 123 TaxID=3423403 RepID=UPI003F1B66AF
MLLNFRRPGRAPRPDRPKGRTRPEWFERSDRRAWCPSAARRARGALRALRTWRRTRPFWAGVLLLLGGAELLVVPLAPWTVLLGLGLGGVAAIGIGTALIAAGLFLWFLPHTRHYVGIHAVILSVLSFAATNLGGFLVGMLLGIAGGAMGFAWTPKEPAPGPEPEAHPEPEPEGVSGPRPRDAGQDTPRSRPGPGEAERTRPERRGAFRAARRGSGPGVGGTPSTALAGALPVLLLLAVAAPGPAPGGPAPVTAARTPPTVTTERFAPSGFTLASVEEVPTVAGPRRAMVFRMRAATLTEYRLRTRDGGGAPLVVGVDALRLSGDVTLHLTRFSGCLQGL